MGNIINIIVFVVLNIALMVYLFRYSARIKNPQNSQQYLLLEGAEMFLIVLLATSTLALSAGGGGRGGGTGFNLQAIRLLVLEVLLILSCFVATRPARWGVGTVMYVVFMAWAIYSLSYCPSPAYGVRYLLKYVYPLVIMLACSAIVRDEAVFLSACVWMRRVAIVSVLLYVVPGLRGLFLSDMFWYITALNLHYVVVVCISLALYYFYGRDWKDLALAVLFFIPCILTVHRTGLLCIFTGAAVFFFYKFKLISLPYIAAVLGVGVAIVFYNPSFHEKMFWREGETGSTLTVQDLREGNIGEEDIRNNGREALWEILEGEYYKGHELTGSGIGSCQYFLYEKFNGVKQTHGDYVQMRCDTGLIGLYLYIAVAIAVLLHCFVVVISPYEPDHVKCCAMIAAGSIAGQYFGMYSDNVVAYTMCTTGTSFAFYGMMLGMKAATTKPKEELHASHL